MGATVEESMNASEYRSAVARAYSDAPVYTVPSACAWLALQAETMATYQVVKQLVEVVPVDMADPYLDHVDMFHDIARGRLMVSDVNHNHPLWSPEVNRAFRAVHDIMGHHGALSGFDWGGELAAWGAHDKWVQAPLAKGALFTESLGQVAWALSNGGQFGPQKVALLPQWLRWAHTEEYGVAA